MPRLLVCCALLLASCGPEVTPTVSSPTSTPPQPISTKPVATEGEFALFRAGQSYGDSANDMAISFLDVVGFEATVDEESEVLEVVLQMRDVPSTTPLEQIPNIIQYSWVVFVYLDPATSNLTDVPGDYYFAVNTSISDTSDLATPAAPTPTPSGPDIVPISDLLQNKSVYDSEGMPKSKLEAVADPDLDVLTLTGNVPGITSNALFSFATSYFEGTIDRPESANLPEAAPSPTIAAPSVPPISDATQLTPVGEVRAYPGPMHYAGDVLTFEILTDGSSDESVTVKLTLDGQDTREIKAQGLFDRILLPLALDTTKLSGTHTVRFTTADGRLNQAYSFEVLPADQRSENEENASWLVNEIDCCRLHYISNTAAARDIKFISEQFQRAHKEVLSITGGSMDAKLNVYLIDRIWGNGGFAGEDGIVISYTDRYYGPTIGEKGLETLARHELTHITHLPGSAGDGVFFNYEGPAVYVAGGHYKPEPLAERGAALYDLGYYVPIEEHIDQHELSYLHAAAVLTYIEETYGSEKIWEFLTADADPKDGQPAPLETAIQSTFGISMNQFDQDFKAWLESKDPGPQLDDLRLTIELQDLRRKYQETYAAPPYSIAWNVADTVTRPEYLPVLIREASVPANAATELIIADAQQAIVDGDYTTAEQLIRILEEVIASGSFEDALAKDYLDIVLVLEDAGYDVLSLDLQGDQATVEVTREPPTVTSLELQKVDQHWQVKP
ncbi:MAG TPA: hypothetical protein VFR47_19590 [Anaerolineales bacterium]|nr:hypothetical protein [Anaerolineales bacterium]